MPERAQAVQRRNPDTTIRPALPQDAAGIAALYRQLVGNPAVSVLPPRIAELSTQAHTRLLVCEHGGEVVGTALVCLCADVMFGTQPFAVVENIAVSAEVRSQGLGSMLLGHIETLCLQADCSKIMLLSAIQRADAHRFFERAGFIGSSKRGFVKYRRDFGVLTGRIE